MKHLSKIRDAQEAERRANPVMAMEGIATEGIKEWLGGLLAVFKSKDDEGNKKTHEPTNVIQEKNRNGDAIIRYIKGTYLDDQYLAKRTETNVDISLDGTLAVLSINTRKPQDLFRSIDDYLRAIEKLITDSKPDRVKFYQIADKELNGLLKTPTAQAVDATIEKFAKMEYPLDKWLAKAPNYKTHVGGVAFEIDTKKPWHDWNHYNFSIRSDAHDLMPSFSKEQVKQAAQLMIQLVTNIFRGQYGMFDELSEGMSFAEPDYDALYDVDGIDEKKIDLLYEIESALIDRRDVNWKAITVPYVTSFEHMLLALDNVIQRSLRPI